MSFFLLIVELFLAVIEGGWVWLFLTIGAFACVAITFKSGALALRVVSRRYRENRSSGQSWWTAALQTTGSRKTIDRDLLEAILHLHVILIPPWYGFIILDEYFAVGLYVICFLTVPCWLSRSFSSRADKGQAERSGSDDGLHG